MRASMAKVIDLRDDQESGGEVESGGNSWPESEAAHVLQIAVQRVCGHYGGNGLSSSNDGCPITSLPPEHADPAKL